MKKLMVLVALCFGTAGMLSAEKAQADLLVNWTDPDLAVVSVDDSTDAANARDITKAWHATDGIFHYFRMDLAAAPGEGQTNAGMYGIYIDAIPNAGSLINETYVPNIAGIDYALDSHFSVQGGGFTQFDFHTIHGMRLT